jgi:NitT/TauT family transport system ATP-binding protein
MSIELSLPYISVNNVSKKFIGKRTDITVLDNISFSLRKGEFFCLLGPSGCGKSTLVDIIAGFTKASSGYVSIESKRVDAPLKKTVSIFQGYGLLPWRTVEHNVELALEGHIYKKERKELVRYYLDLVGLSDFAEHHPFQLSGGMKQRTAIARALAADPDIIFMDEPFGALDAITRYKMQEEIIRIWQKKRKTIIFITHDIEESVYLSDTIAVMSPNPGTIKRLIKVPLARYRDRTSYDFLQIRDQVFDALEMKQPLLQDYSV